MQYFNKLNSTKIICFAKNDIFPSYSLKNLQDIFGEFFYYGKLQSDFHVWHTFNESACKNLSEMMNNQSEISLKSAFFKVFCLAQIISTIPTTTVSAEVSLLS